MNHSDNENTPAIYVACLNARDNFINHGEWINATQNIEAIKKQIDNILDSSPYMNNGAWGVIDSNNFGDLDLQEYSMEDIACIARLILENGNLAIGLLNHCVDLEEAEKMLKDSYHGLWDSSIDYLNNLIHDCYDLPEWIAPFIDYENLWNNYFSHDYIEIETNEGTHIFSAH